MTERSNSVSAQTVTFQLPNRAVVDLKGEYSNNRGAVSADRLGNSQEWKQELIPYILAGMAENLEVDSDGGFTVEPDGSITGD